MKGMVVGRQPVCLPQLTAFYLKTQVKLFCDCDALRVCAAWYRREKKGVRQELLNAAPKQSYWGQRGGAVLSSSKEISQGTR